MGEAFKEGVAVEGDEGFDTVLSPYEIWALVFIPRLMASSSVTAVLSTSRYQD